MDALNTALARIQGERVYIDANIFIYFLDGHSTYFDPIAAFFRLFDQGVSLACTGDAVVAEVLYRPFQMEDMKRLQAFRAFFDHAEFVTVLAHDRGIFEAAAELAARHRMKLIDALHVATALASDCRYLLTNDRGVISSGTLEVLLLDALRA